MHTLMHLFSAIDIIFYSVCVLIAIALYLLTNYFFFYPFD